MKCSIHATTITVFPTRICCSFKLCTPETGSYLSAPLGECDSRLSLSGAYYNSLDGQILDPNSY